MTTIFVCEDSLDGILTGVYEAWDSRLGHENVRLQTEAEGTLELFCQYRPVRRDLEKAEKVLRTVRRRMGEKAREAVCYAAACTDERKADAIYRLIVLGLSMADGTKAVDCLQNPAVLLVEKLRYKAWHEAERMLGFLRFEELENGVLYARMEPPYAVLPLIAPHFADRLYQENWIIHDLRRGQAAVHRAGGGWFLTEAEAFRGGTGVPEALAGLLQQHCHRGTAQSPLPAESSALTFPALYDGIWRGQIPDGSELSPSLPRCLHCRALPCRLHLTGLENHSTLR